MGFLDDAIREHLDLKRRRGADPTEVERAEREALGPVRRDPFEHGPDEPAAEVAAAPEAAYDQAAEADYEHQDHGDDWGEAFEDEPAGPARPQEAVAEEHEPFAEEPFADEPSPLPEEHFEEEPGYAAAHPAEGEAVGEPLPPEPEAAHEALPAEPEAAHEPLPAEPEAAYEALPAERGVGDETMEYDVEETFTEEDGHASPSPAHEEPPHGEEDDVLEETPEFLQDAPEHDRLWFEQRPPRDFDFDG